MRPVVVGAPVGAGAVRAALVTTNDIILLHIGKGGEVVAEPPREFKAKRNGSQTATAPAGAVDVATECPLEDMRITTFREDGGRERQLFPDRKSVPDAHLGIEEILAAERAPQTAERHYVGVLERLLDLPPVIGTVGGIVFAVEPPVHRPGAREIVLELPSLRDVEVILPGGPQFCVVEGMAMGVRAPPRERTYVPVPYPEAPERTGIRAEPHARHLHRAVLHDLAE